MISKPAVWAVAQDYVGPDGIARRRDGLVASLGVEPYETRTVLPHERTHAGPKESRLRLLRAARAQLEPIFLLYDGEPPVGIPDRDPDLADGGHEALAAPGRRRSRGVRRPPAAHRRRPSSVRDRRRIRRRGGDSRERAHDGRARLDVRSRPRDLPDASPLSWPRRRAASSRRRRFGLAGRRRCPPRRAAVRPGAGGRLSQGRHVPGHRRGARARRRARRSPDRSRGARVHGRPRGGGRSRRLGRVRRGVPAAADPDRGRVRAGPRAVR